MSTHLCYTPSTRPRASRHCLQWWHKTVVVIGTITAVTDQQLINTVLRTTRLTFHLHQLQQTAMQIITVFSDNLLPWQMPTGHTVS